MYPKIRIEPFILNINNYTVFPYDFGTELCNKQTPPLRTKLFSDPRKSTDGGRYTHRHTQTQERTMKNGGEV